MPNTYAFENLFRQPWELMVSAFSFLVAIFIFSSADILVISSSLAYILSSLCLLLSAKRFLQSLKVIKFRKNLLKQKAFSLSTNEVPISTEQLYIGKGFKFNSTHRQRLFLLNKNENQMYVDNNEDNIGIGGKPWIHGVGSNDEHDIFINQNTRNSHHIVFGMTRVGKTRLASILINQDIRNNEAVLILDPKGDTELLQDIYSAANSLGRLSDLIILHAGYPDISAKYNPLKSFSNVSEVATRVTSAIDASGEGKQFRDFAWKFLNITATCLHEMGETVSYKNLSFFVTRPKQLLMAYSEKTLSKSLPNYTERVNQILIINQENKKPGQPDFTRADAVKSFVGEYIDNLIEQDTANSVQGTNMVELYQAAQLGEEYYGKITASLGPVFDKINKTDAGQVFSWEKAIAIPEISLSDCINKKQIVYIGLNSMENSAMSEAVGKAVISDLISLCGKLYRTSQTDTSLCLHADEFSEIVQEDFITLVNKAGGAGVKVTAYTQTINDLGQAFSSGDKAKQLLGNFGTTTMLRVANKDTAETFCECLETTTSRSTVPVSTSSDKPNNNFELFNTNNSDQISEKENQLLNINDLFSLPKGQAFTLTNGGNLYKLRFPLPKNDGEAPKTLAATINEVNLCEI